jgi:hypothetical protein
MDLGADVGLGIQPGPGDARSADGGFEGDRGASGIEFGSARTALERISSWRWRAAAMIAALLSARTGGLLV